MKDSYLFCSCLMSYVSYILLLTCQHGQPVQDWGGGQGVRPLHQDLDEVAGSKLSKNWKFWTAFWLIVLMTKLYCNKTFKCSHQVINNLFLQRDVRWRTENVHVEVPLLKSWRRWSDDAVIVTMRRSIRDCKEQITIFIILMNSNWLGILFKLLKNLKLQYLSNRTS